MPLLSLEGSMATLILLVREQEGSRRERLGVKNNLIYKLCWNWIKAQVVDQVTLLFILI